MTDALETLARELDKDAEYLERVAGTIASDMRVAARYRAAAAACRELADLRGCCCGDGWIDDFFSTDLRDSTDTALAAFMENHT